MTAYYNENDPGAAAWLRELIKGGHIAQGEVDGRSILDIRPADLDGFDQCHFFAGIGVWSYALRLAEIPDDFPIWTGSAPCQPFSAAGKQRGAADERHLWPAWQWLISQCLPDRIVGEQVAGKAAMQWFDTVATDLEGEGYAVGQVVFPACSVGAPHLRQRLYWLAQPPREQHNGSGGARAARGAEHPDGSADGAVADSDSERYNREHPLLRAETPGRNPPTLSETAGRCKASFWSDAEPIGCADGKTRLVKSSIHPLADRTPGSVVSGSVNSTQEARTMRLKGHGNAIVAPQAAEFIKAALL